MPAKSANTKKNTSSIFKKTIPLNSTKGRLTVILLSFAVIGAGLYVYHSFAATPSWSFSLANQGISLSSDITGNCKSYVANETGKTPIQVAVLNCPESPVGSATAKISGLQLADNLVNKPYRLCVNVKGTGSGLLTMSVPMTNYPAVSAGSTNVTATSTAYTYACSAVQVPNALGKIEGNLTTKSTSKLVISEFKVEQVQDYSSTSSTDSAGTTSPSPTK